MNKEEIKDYITELENMFELSELEEHRINILKVGIYINQLQQKNQKYKEVIDKAIEYIENYRDYQDILIGRTKFESGDFFTEDILREENITKLLDVLKEVE